MSKTASKTYLISGVALSGNKGASGMTEALIQNIRERDSGAKFYILSYYPAADRKLVKDFTNVELLDGSPKKVVFRLFDAIFAGVCLRLHLPCRRFGGLGKIAKCDCWLDASGISFVDGREKFTAFNIFTIFPALALKIPVIKVAQ
ncbi:MAG: hypothetical protein LBM70_06875, partial [Victivallales bacterium]|nr:hypothetical protein [Victivallales bacterium]